MHDIANKRLQNPNKYTVKGKAQAQSTRAARLRRGARLRREILQKELEVGVYLFLHLRYSKLLLTESNAPHKEGHILSQIAHGLHSLEVVNAVANLPAVNVIPI